VRRCLERRSLRASAIALVLGSFSTARADDLDDRHSGGYYGRHIGLTAVGFAGAGMLTAFLSPSHPGLEPFPRFGPDVSVRDLFNPGADALSYTTLYVSIGLPVALQLSDGYTTELGNMALVYAEAHAATALLTTLAKITVARPRPYTHNERPELERLEREQGSSAYVSFFSGHSSHAYTAAMAGSILYAMRTDDLAARHTVWGLEFSLAALTAQLRVCAGRHYRTDVWLGTLVGAGIGLAVPALNRMPLSRIRASEWLTGAGAAAATIGTMELGIGSGSCSAACGTYSPDRERSPRENSVSWLVLPQVAPVGLILAGEL
jgi:membrane-associated phospholipid phosphatase